ncbi:MAG: hypothetical protein QW418_05470 [Candidatus Korarchaeum sp.]
MRSLDPLRIHKLSLGGMKMWDPLNDIVNFLMYILLILSIVDPSLHIVPLPLYTLFPVLPAIRLSLSLRGESGVLRRTMLLSILTFLITASTSTVTLMAGGRMLDELVRCSFSTFFLLYLHMMGDIRRWGPKFMRTSRRSALSFVVPLLIITPLITLVPPICRDLPLNPFRIAVSLSCLLTFLPLIHYLMAILREGKGASSPL